MSDFEEWVWWLLVFVNVTFVAVVMVLFVRFIIWWLQQ